MRFAHTYVASHLSLPIIFNIVFSSRYYTCRYFLLFISCLYPLPSTLITTAQSLIYLLSILLNFKTSRDVKMKFCHTLHNKAFTRYNPGCLTSRNVSRSITVKSEGANGENHRDGLIPPMRAKRRSRPERKFRPRFLTQLSTIDGDRSDAT